MTYQQYKELQIATHGADSFNIQPQVLNLFGIRSACLDGGKFDDIIGVAYLDDTGNEVLEQYPATTDPGLQYLQTPINVKGTGILAPGFYKNFWKRGIHKGYLALIQCGNAKAYRDTDRDKQLDFMNLQTITPDTRCDLHGAWKDNKARQNINYSAMCQVLQDWKDFQHIMDLADRQIATSNHLFNYTLWYDLRIG